MEESEKSSGRWRSCCAAFWIFYVKFSLYMLYVQWAAAKVPWHHLFAIEQPCGYEPLPANQSGVKVLIAGFAKMGTRTLSRTLYELGYERSYHGEDFLLHVWHPLTYDHWSKPENGGMVTPPVGTGAAMSSSYDLEVLQNITPEHFAARISACHVDAAAFDGAEKLFWPVFDASPDVKVLVLNWRTFEEAKKSMDAFVFYFMPWLIIVSLIDSGAYALPWGLLFNAAEPLLGRPIRKLLETGSPPFMQVQRPYMVLWLRLHGGIRWVGHWFMGLSEWWDMTTERYDEFFSEIRRRVPPEKRLDVDPRKTTYEDLCRFLGLEPCKRSGRLPRAINVGNAEFDFFPAWTMCIPIWLIIHVLNFRVFNWVVVVVLAGLTFLVKALWRRLSLKDTKAD